MAGGRIKGAAIREFVRWYGAQYGEAQVAKLADSMPPEFRALVNPRAPHLGLIASEWYPAGGIHIVLDHMVSGLGVEERERISREGAQAVIHETLHGVYKIFFELMVSPERYMKNAPRLFSRFFDHGSMEKSATGPREHTSHIRGWEAHHPLLCDFLLHVSEYVYAAMGCKEVQVERFRCRGNGDEECAYRIRWA
jgi:hypothetical protein